VGSWCSGRRRDASERLGPQIAYVFDEDVTIDNDERVKWAIAWRYNVALIGSPQKETRTGLWSKKLSRQRGLHKARIMMKEDS